MPKYTTYKCGEMDFNFFSRDVALYRFISGFPQRGQTYKAMLRENLLSAHQWNKSAE